MKRNKLLFVVSQLVMAVAMVAVMGAYGLSQTPEKMDATPKSAIDSAKEARRAAARAIEEARSSTGWLILDGKLIPGPYDIVLEDDCIKINGLPYMAPKPPEPTEDIEIPEYIIKQHAISNAMVDTFYKSFPVVGLDSARSIACSFAESQTEVDSTRVYSPRHIEVFFEWSSIPMHYLLLPADPPEPHEKVRKEVLEHGASSLRGWLTHGCLVITKSTGGYIESRQPPRAGEILKELRRIAATIPDLQERIAAVKKIIHHDGMAEAIAREFKSE